MKNKNFLGLILMGILFFSLVFNFNGLTKNILERIQDTIITASITLTSTVGMAKTTQTFESYISQTINLTNPDQTQLTLDIPAGILPVAEEIEAKIVSLNTNDILFYFPSEKKPIDISVGPLYRIDLVKTADQSTISSLVQPINLIFSYNQKDVAGVIEENEIKAYFWDGLNWVILPSTVYPDQNKVIATVDHLSIFGIFGPHIKRYTSGYPYIPAATPPSLPVPAAAKKIKADINNDGEVNLVDFSIMAYWWNRILTPAALAQIDLNSDGKLNLTDFSIMAYWWGRK